MNGSNDSNRQSKRAVLAGGCFWCTEAVFQDLEGVLAVTSGYTGGEAANPTYQQVCTGTTGHAEAVAIDYDPSVITYRDLLEIFFGTHDPTTLNRQGNDVGTQYRSAIFYADEAELAEARRMVDELESQGVFGAPVVTTLEPLGEFWEAEAYHRNYFRNNPDQAYCSVVIAPKVAKFRQKYSDRLRAPAGA